MYPKSVFIMKYMNILKLKYVIYSYKITHEIAAYIATFYDSNLLIVIY